jgi:multimeric flavodoxin WrbA
MSVLSIALLLSLGSTPVKILVLYGSDQFNHTGTLAGVIATAASNTTDVKAIVRCKDVSAANYKRDVSEWADAVVIGSPVINGNAATDVLSFINSFDFQDDLSGVTGSTFATGGGAAGGLQPVLEQLNRGLMTFGLVVTGGGSWRNAEGTGLVVPDGNVQLDANSVRLATMHGERIARWTAKQKAGASPPGGIPTPLYGITRVLDSVALSLGRAKWTKETQLNTTCEAYCRGWTAAVGCGTCASDAFSFPGGAEMCVHPGPLGTGLLCRMNETTGEPTPKSCCGVGGPCQLPKPSQEDWKDKSQWPGGCCWGGDCGKCPGGSPISDEFPLLNETRTIPENRRYFDTKTSKCMVGVAP